MITVDKAQGMACDIGTIYHGDNNDGAPVIVNIALTDENEMSFTWYEGKKCTDLYVPIDRVKALLVP